MPPRHVYWTIIVDGKPTAFRAHSRDELLPTLRQLQSRHPDAVMKWFARGKLWESQEEERAAARNRAGEHRGRDWRPGGEHQDPRARFKVPRDVKRQRFAARQRREGFEERGGRNRRENGESRPKPPWDSRRPPASRPEWQRRERRDRGPADRPREDRAPGNRPPWNREGRPRDQQRAWNPEDGPPTRREGDRREWQRDRRPPGGPRNEFRDRKPGSPGFGGPPAGRPPHGRPQDQRGEGARGRGEPPQGGRQQGGHPPGSRPKGRRSPGGGPRGPGGWRKPGGGGGKKGGGGAR